VQKAFIDGTEKRYHEIIDALKKQLAIRESLSCNQEAMIEALKSGNENLNALIEGMKAKDETRGHQVEALEQTEMASRAMQQTADHYAIESRSTLAYIIERSDNGLDTMRLWEALPEDQKDIYRKESLTWLGKQPSHVDPALRARMKPAPKKELL